MALARRFESLVSKETRYNNLAQLLKRSVFTSLCALELNSTYTLVKAWSFFWQSHYYHSFIFLKKGRVSYPGYYVFSIKSQMPLEWMCLLKNNVSSILKF
jgi:hypothetical protein